MNVFDTLLNEFKLRNTKEVKSDMHNIPPITPYISSKNYPQNNGTIILSQISSLPRYYTINGKKYDLDNPEDIYKLPVFRNIIEINGVECGMDSILRKHAREAYVNNKAIYNAAVEKEEEYRDAGIHFTTSEEKAKEEQRAIVLKEREQENQEYLNLHNSFKIFDMYQFTEIPFEWKWVMELNHTNGIAWFILNKNNQYIALSAINYINSIMEESYSYTHFDESLYICTENIDFFYPIPMEKDSIANTYVECIPYTKTGRISKYPAILHFREQPEKHIYNGSTLYVYKVFGSIYFLADGNIGKANLSIQDYWIQIRLNGLHLIVQRIGKNTPNGNVEIYRKKI